MIEQILPFLQSIIGSAITVVIVIIFYVIAQRLLSSKIASTKKSTLLRQIILFIIILIGFISILISLPIESGLKGQIIGLIGIVLSASLALSATTLLGNAFAGIMIRVVNNFKIGDFIKTDKHFGRVSDAGLFHVEIQTEDSDLITIPNLYIATQPVKVIRSTGTIISSEVSLGYDVSVSKIEKCLLEAAKNAELKDPFVFVTYLGDYSIVYKVHGMLTNVKRLLSARSKLKKMMLKNLHEAGIEIVSPTFMNQRQVNDVVFIPKKERKAAPESEKIEKPEEIIFNKAQQAETIERKKERIEEIENELEALEKELKEADDRVSIKKRINKLESLKVMIQGKIDSATDEMNGQ